MWLRFVKWREYAAPSGPKAETRKLGSFALNGKGSRMGEQEGDRAFL